MYSPHFNFYQWGLLHSNGKFKKVFKKIHKLNFFFRVRISIFKNIIMKTETFAANEVTFVVIERNEGKLLEQCFLSILQF